ncbi:hypothetical protein N6H05_00450 [Sphingobium sp. WTD-1]|uniref:hypothetical protein n=1 Tax=Sphingobium sp. WTD-1 TaxID=2979467 RepID=UPI0024DE17EB|nr:hypothetical protein [Sphingobium sp. WTD-1]WIA56340.1 hypothetical protein N6H05_00450 [Sphingobium sp. WTD-1]
MPKFTPSMRGLAIMALAAAGGGALVVLTLPVGWVEMLVASSGLSETIPAAGPPLGMKARLLLAGFAALMSVGIVAAVRRNGSDAPHRRLRISGRRHPDAQGARKMGFAFAKLTALARGRNVPAAEEAAPTQRRADAHPDAPPRPPIFASRDFGGADIFARPESGRRRLVVDSDPVEPVTATVVRMETPAAFAMPTPHEEAPVEDMAIAPAPGFSRPFDAMPTLSAVPIPLGRAPFAPPEDAIFEPWEEEAAAEFAAFDEEPTDIAPEPIVEQAHAFVPEPVIEEPIQAFDPAPEPAPFVPRAEASPAPTPRSIDSLSITELTERLERALVQRGRPATAPRVIADMPIASAVPVREAVSEDVEDALRAALGTLRTMTGRPR